MVRIGLMASRIFTSNRREFLAGLGAAALGEILPGNAAVAGAQAVPIRARTTSLTLRPGQAETQVWSLEGPSPSLRFKRGNELAIALQNDLPAPLGLSWYGLDGVPSAEPLIGQAPAAPGAKASVTAALRHAGTLFADLRLFSDGAGHLSRALALIVEEREPPAVDRDEIFLIEDFRLRTDGTAVSPGSDAKDTTPFYAVNGRILPDIAVQSNHRLRLRFINACQRHVVAVKIDGLEVRVMAMDSQPAEPFPARNSALVLAPGGRADAFVDAASPPGSTSQILLHDGKEARPIARLVTSAAPVARTEPLPIAPPLPPNRLPAQLDLRSAQRIEFFLQGAEWVAPTNFSATASPAFRVRPGRVVVVALTNRASIATVFHLHGHHFRLLDRLDDGWKPYWLDTLALEPGETQRIAFLAEYAGRYLLESTATDWAAPRLVRWYAVE
ncbi:MAG TPA: multicopper oxidase domain-containing protein [Bradyrhizobium sp.]